MKRRLLISAVLAVFVATFFVFTRPQAVHADDTTVSCTGDDCDEGPLPFDDGRVNSNDATETAAVYCEDDGGVSVWNIVNSKGYFAFTVTADELAEIDDYPEQNTLIKSGSGVSLYRLTSGELQINAPNNYVFIWDGCSE